MSISISYRVLPQIKEYERTSTTATNAYVKPLTGRYLSRLAGRLESIGFKGKLFIMLSSGGVTSVETAAEFPVRIIESGPTAAVIAVNTMANSLISQKCSASTWEALQPSLA
jgi:N-methylhydantoinase A